MLVIVGVIVLNNGNLHKHFSLCGDHTPTITFWTSETSGWRRMKMDFGINYGSCALWSIFPAI